MIRNAPGGLFGPPGALLFRSSVPCTIPTMDRVFPTPTRSAHQGSPAMRTALLSYPGRKERTIFLFSFFLFSFSLPLARAADAPSAPVATLKGHTETVYAI